MKRLFTLFLIFLTFSAFAQRGRVWVGLALKGGYGTGFLYNDYAFFNDDQVFVHLFTPAYSYGGRLNFEFGESNVSLSFEGLMTEFGQDFEVFNGGNSTLHSAKVQEIDAAVVFKLSSAGGFYFEVGPQMNLIKSAYLDNVDIAKELTDHSISFIAGIGFMPVFNQYFEISLGLRSMFSLGNIMETDFNVYNSSPNAYAYTTNNIMKVVFVPMIDVNWIFAYMGRASCGKFRIMFNK